MACSKCKSASCSCEEKYLKIEGCLATCSTAKLIVSTFGPDDQDSDVDVPKDPSSLTVTVDLPDGQRLRFFWSPSASDGITRLAEGVFVITLFLAQYGRYDVNMVTTGRSRSLSDHFFVEDSGIDCDLNTLFSLTDGADTFAATLVHP